MIEPTPDEWRDKLHEALGVRQATVKRCVDYYDGKHRELLEQDKFRPRLVEIFRQLRLNLCEPAIDVPTERLSVEGFRFSGGEGTADPEAWNIWQRNGMDAAQEQLFSDALLTGYGAVIVWGDQDGEPVISVESGANVIVATMGRMRRAALKVWKDEWTDTEYATLYVPDRLYRWEKQRAGQAWAPRKADEVVENPLGVVPVVPLVNSTKVDGKGKSHLAELIPVQDLLNKTLVDLMVAAEASAFRQRWATGVEVPEDPQTKQPVSPWKPAIDKVWVAEEEQAKFGEFGEATLTNYTGTLAALVTHFGALSRVPSHYLLAQAGQWPTGDALRSAEMPLVKFVRSRMRQWGESLEDVMRLAFAVKGDQQRAADVLAETAWADPETRSEAERADALVKRASIGVPYRQLWLDAGYTETQCDQFDQWLVDAVQRGVMARLNVPAAAMQGQADNAMADGPAPAA